jgi:hypothetical protein
VNLHFTVLLLIIESHFHSHFHSQEMMADHGTYINSGTKLPTTPTS